MTAPLLHVQELAIELGPADRPWRPVTSISLEVRGGEVLGLMGRSGAGKTLTALSLLGLLPRPARIAAGSILWKGREITGYQERQWQRLRGREIAMIFQDPLTALHPLYPVDRQVAEALRTHQPSLGRRAAREQAAALLERTGIATARLTQSAHPFEWSGGMRQRAVIAMAMANRPALVIADEPTTALDVTTQARILELLRELQRETHTAILFITHDPAVMLELADRVAVLRDGHIVETGPAADVLRQHVGRQRPSPAGEDAGGLATHATRAWSVTMSAAGAAVAAKGAGLLSVDRLSVRYPIRTRRPFARRGFVQAVDEVSLELGAGEVLGLVGESGCGKSTLARSLVRLEEPIAGRIVLAGRDITHVRGQALREARAAIQIVFQDPFSSLNPRRRVGASIAQPLHIHGRYVEAGGTRRVHQLLEQVALPVSYAERFPHELSGGERQRVAIARALALGPRVLILDEPVSSLDRPTQATIVDLVRSLQASLGLACLFIAHDLRVVRDVADRIAVMSAGRIVETAPAAAIFDAPAHPYTRALLAALPGATARHPRPPGEGEESD